MKSRGFTLIELLVVIGIIAVMAAILFPVFAQARLSARKVVCLSNVKQLGLAIAMYNQDYDERYVLGWRRGYVNRFKEGPGRAWWQEGVMPYIKNKGVFQCPTTTLPVYYWGEDKKAEQLAMTAGTYRFETGLALNWYLPAGHRYGITDAGYWGRGYGGSHEGFSEAEVYRPAERITILETGNAVMGGPCPNLAKRLGLKLTYEEWAAGPYDGYFGQARHAGFMNVGFADGHAKAVKPSATQEQLFDILHP